MNRPLAVRFLLLKHLWKLRTHVSADRYAEVVGSLSVQSSPTGFLVRWRCEDQAREHEIPSRALTLYARGDAAEPARDADDARTEETAHAFARVALGLSEEAETPAAPTPREFPWAVAGPVIALIAVGLSGGRALFPAASVLVLAAVGEIAPRWGPILLAGAGIVLVPVAPPAFAATWNVIVGVLQFLSPYAPGRALRSLVNIGAGLIAVMLGIPLGLAGRPATLVLALAALFLAVARSAFGRHRRLMPLALPLALGALALEGGQVPAAVGLVVLSVELAILAQPRRKPID